MAGRRGEYTFKQLGDVLLERTVGDVTIRLIAEFDTAAEVPADTVRLRSGRVLNRGDLDLISNGITFTGDNFEAMLAAYPEILEIVRKMGPRLPKRSKNSPVKSSKPDAVEAELAKAFLGSKAPELPAAPAAAGSRAKAKRAF
jgi:hypothetical protein